MTTETATPTGIPIRDCRECGRAHPITRKHCDRCGNPSAFIRPDGECLQCTQVGK